MQLPMIVEAQLVDPFVHRFVMRGEATAMQTRDLERALQALGPGIVPTVALPAHRVAHPELLKQILEFVVPPALVGDSHTVQPLWLFWVTPIIGTVLASQTYSRHARESQ